MKINSVVYCKIKLDDLIPMHRITSQKKFALLTNSFKEKGILDPLIIHRFENKNNIMIGNNRFYAAKSMMYKEIPCVVVNFNDSTPLEGEKVTTRNISKFFHSDGEIEIKFKDNFIIQARITGWESRIIGV